MTRPRTIALAIILPLVLATLWSQFGGTARSATVQQAAEARTQDIVKAATTFVDTLVVDQKVKVQFGFTPQEKATLARFKPQGAAGSIGKGPPGGFVGEKYGDAVWSNYPVSDVPRPGLQLGVLSSIQRAAAMQLLQALLSATGYQKVLDIMGSDQALADSGTPFASGSAVYTIGIFGTPSASGPWMVQFGGHHLALNIVIAGARGALPPTLTGAQPAIYSANGKIVRVLAGENDKGFALLDALDPRQRKQAILNTAWATLFWDRATTRRRSYPKA